MPSQPQTPLEWRLRKVWAEILELPAQNISRNDNFVHLGGDEAAVGDLASATQGLGLRLNTAQILEDPRLSAVAASISPSPTHYKDGHEVLQPFGLLQPRLKAFVLGLELKKTYRVLESCVIENALPCTGFQDDLMDIPADQQQFCWVKLVYRLANHVDAPRFKAAWNQVVELCPNLRTRIVRVGYENLQLHARHDICWAEGDQLDTTPFLSPDNTPSSVFGSPLSRYALVEGPDGTNYFVLAMHHAVYDSWTASLMVDCLANLYHGSSRLALQPFGPFIKYVKEINGNDAREYWSKEFKDLKRSTFPSSSSTAASNKASIRRVMEGIHSQAISNITTTASSLFQAAWALLLAQYSKSNDVCFGTITSGRLAPVTGIHGIAGSIAATVPIRIQINPKNTTEEWLRDLQDQANAMAPYEHLGLTKIGLVSPEAKEACRFTSFLTVQDEKENLGSEPIMTLSSSHSVGFELTAHPTCLLALRVATVGGNTILELSYNRSAFSEKQAASLLYRLEHLVLTLLSGSGKSVGSLLAAKPCSQDPITWSRLQLPGLVNSPLTFHELVQKQALTRPDAVSIHAWDAKLTYRQLDEMSTRLSLHLTEGFNVNPHDLVLVCFEKSAWHFVSILAINKAGAAWVPLDPSHPTQRLQQVASQAGATLALTSKKNVSLLSAFVKDVVEVSPSEDSVLLKAAPATRARQTHLVLPSDMAYVLFTSGSTGTPKGLVMEHGAASISQKAIAQRLGIKPGVRMLQFAAFVFDFSIGEIMCPLMHGATVYVPSENQRLDRLVDYIRETQVNCAFLTPTFARTLDPIMLPSIEVLVLGGEAVDRETFDLWFGKVRLWNAWGPAEDCCISTLHEWKSKDESTMTIGRPVGSACWLVSQKDSSKIAASGTIGEVVIQSPTLFRHYLAAPEKTKTSFLPSPPQWCPDNESQGWNRVYKTGDLCKYNLATGVLEFCTRRDTQVKVRGMRVEVGDVEHGIQVLLPSACKVVVDLVKTDKSSQLVAFLCFNNDMRLTSDISAVFCTHPSELQAEISDMIRALPSSMPPYMVPTHFITCKFLPAITSTKLDRKGLRDALATLNSELLASFSMAVTDKRPPETEMEIKLQLIWADILRLPESSIGRDDNFLRIGGDSITAIHVVTAARAQSIDISVKTIFDDPRLLAVAQKATWMDVSDVSSLTLHPFELLDAQGSDMKSAVLSSATFEACKLSSGQSIENAMPCTALQEGLMAISVKRPQSYIAKWVYRVNNNIPIAGFKAAWEATMQTCSTLRNRIIYVADSMVQVCVKNDIQWEACEGMGLYDYLRVLNLNIKMSMGDRLCRYALISEPSGERYFVLTLHHAVYDGWTMRLLHGALWNAYHGSRQRQVLGFDRFIKYVQDMDKEAAGKYWSDQLAGAQRAAFPPATNGSSGLTRMINRRCNLPQMADASITKASILRAAWAVVLARYSESDDICFGTTVSGRQAPVHDLSDMAGPCVATVPVRILINRDQSVADFVSSVQTQASKMIAYEQFGIPNISKLTPEAQAACDFTSLLVIQPVQKMAEIDDHGNAILVPFEMDEDIVQSSLEAYFTYPLVVQTLVSDDFFDFSLTYDTSMLAESNMSALLNHLEQVIRLLLEDGSKPVGDVKLAGDWDLNEARAANDEQQTVIDATLHKLFTEQAKLRPDATAINAWDEKLTYGQLDDMSSRLASFLMLSKGVKPGDLIAVCFEKSAWYVVSILAVNKAGAAWVPLDPSHPLERHHQIFQQIGTDVLLSSSKNLHHCSQLTDHVVEVNWNLDNQLLSCAEELPSLEVSPSDPVYVIFTSGSTGKPKGIVMNHGALCTSQLAIIARLGLTSTAKVLQFAAFVFDISIGEIAATLLCGATVCMPSDENRMSNSGLVDFMNGTGVTWSWLTPSFSQTLRPESVPSLGHLIFTGEKANQDCFDLWFGKVRLYNGWGPAETCVVSSIYEYQSKDDAFATMGSPVAAMAWVVDPCNPHQLAPIGVHGELVIQGPTILREYLGEPEKTDASIITNLPSWAPRRYEPHWDRFYMTGDICFYNSHGRLEYVGRKDTQVKIRGLRIELGEIEQQVRSVLDASHLSYQICVEMVDGCVGPTLCCFLCPNEVSYTSGEIEGGLAMGLSEALRSKLLVVDSAVSASLPPYMVPSYYIACRWAPISTSAKLDRKRLRTMAADLSYEELTTYSLTKDTKADPETALENQLRQTWAEVLQIQEDYIGIDDDFYRIGGDSIRAVWLTKRIEEEQNVKLGASLIQSNRTTIRIMAKVIDSNKNGGTLEIEHMDLLSEVTALSKELTGNTVRPLIDSATVAPSTEAVVFLTGAAGYLGSDLLRRIVRLDSTKSVIVLIRSKSAQHGMERVKGTAQTMGWWDDCYADKIEVWPGDLDKERMGLTDAQWTRLSGCSSDGSNVNTIVHNGAAVNWVASYEQLRAANVQSVLDLLNVTINSPTKPRYVFISGGVKLDLSDRAASASMLASLSGYIQTKYVAETAIQDVMDQLPACQNRLSVIKPGRILGTAEEGVANLDDYLWRVVATAISLRAHPVDTLDVWMPCATVSVISERVLSNLTTDGGVIKFDNMEEGLPSEKFWKLAHTALRMESTPMPWKDWIDLAVAQADRVGPKHPLWPIRGFLSVIGWPETPESPPQSPEETEKLHAAVQSNMKYVVGTGMVDICSGKRHKLHGSFISRSGAAKV